MEGCFGEFDILTLAQPDTVNVNGSTGISSRGILTIFVPLCGRTSSCGFRWVQIPALPYESSVTRNKIGLGQK